MSLSSFFIHRVLVNCTVCISCLAGLIMVHLFENIRIKVGKGANTKKKDSKGRTSIYLVAGYGVLRRWGEGSWSYLDYHRCLNMHKRSCA